MPRRSLRTSSATSTPLKAAEPHRPAARSRTTPKKSQYFSKRPGKRRKSEASDDSDQVSDAESSSPSVADAADSGYEDKDGEGDASEATSSGEHEDEAYSDSDDAPPAKRRKGAGGKGQSTGRVSSTGSVATPVRAKGQELWRHGVKTGLGPGTQVIIDKPKPRAAGKTPYADEKIHPNTMLFLSDLAANNDREWLKMHDPDYRTSWKDFSSFLEVLQQRLIEIDETIPELPLKDIIFRIYRDIRFSPDPTPYKTHFSAAWSRTGRKGPYAAYYVQIKPGGGSFVGGGLWHPEAEPVARLRRDIDRRPGRIKEALKSPGIRKEFFGGVDANDKKVIKAFVSHNSENALKTKPRDYTADHRDIDLLRLKNYTIGRKVRDEDILHPKGIDHIAKLLSCLVPFINYLNSTVMPDEEANESEDEDEEEQESGGSTEESDLG